MIFVTLSGYCEYYPNTANYGTFLVNSMGLEMSYTTTYLHLGKKVWPSHTPCKNAKNRDRSGKSKIKVLCSSGGRMSLWKHKFV